MDHPEQGCYQSSEDHSISSRVGQLAGGARLNRDSRLDAMARQTDELSKMASVMSSRVFQLVERLDGPRPQNARGEDTAPTSPGYLAQMQENFNDIRMSLEGINDYLNELDQLV